MPTESAIVETSNPVAALRRYPLVVLFVAVLFADAGWLYASRRPEVYVSTVGLVVEDSRASSLTSSSAQRYTADQVQILGTRIVAERATNIAALSEPSVGISPEEFLRNTSIRSTSESNFISASFSADSAERAQIGANALGRSYEEVIEAALAEDAATAISELDLVIESTAREIDRLREEAAATPTPTGALLRQQEDAIARSSELSLRKNQIEVDARLAGNGLAFFAPPGLGKEEGLSRSRAGVLMGAVGALAGAGIAYLLASRRQHVENRLQPSSILGTPLLAEVPVLTTPWAFARRLRDRLIWSSGDTRSISSQLPVIDDPGSDRAEPFRIAAHVLARRLGSERLPSQAGASPRAPNSLLRPGPAPTRGPGAGTTPSHRGMIVAVCASESDEGQTAVAANVAIAAGRSGLMVLLLEGATTESVASLTTHIGGRDMFDGLTDVLSHDVQLGDAITPLQTGPGSNVHLLRRGTAMRSEPDLFGVPGVSRILEELASLYDLVILHLPPLLDVGHVGSALQQADQALLVVKHKSRLENLVEMRHRLEILGVKSIGYVYTDSPSRRGAKGPPRSHHPQAEEIARIA